MRKLLTLLITSFLIITAQPAKADEGYNGKELAKRYQYLATKFDQNAKRFVTKSSDKNLEKKLRSAYQEGAIEFAKLAKIARSQIKTSNKIGNKKVTSNSLKTLVNIHQKALGIYKKINKIKASN